MPQPYPTDQWWQGANPGSPEDISRSLKKWMETVFGKRTYAPTMVGSGSNPTYSVNTGLWQQVGLVVNFWAKIIMDVTVGTGTYSISLPVTAHASYWNFAMIGTARYFDASAVGHSTGVAVLDTANHTRCNLLVGNNAVGPGLATNTFPVNPAAVSDEYYISGTYLATDVP